MEADRAVDERQRGGSSTFINALIGAVAGIVLSFVPFSTVLGGMVAGYLERGRNEDGLKVGLFAGLIMFVPFLLIGYFLGVVLILGNVPGLFGGFLAFALFLAAVYTVGAAMLGGLLGVYLRRELGRNPRDDRWA